ncbi:MAG: CpsB/CapC family capsule biosynthesis tyrosine phosphatase [Bacteroidota bacterium]
MTWLNNLFSSKAETIQNPIEWDMHNHLLFGIDDGSKTIEQSLEMARKFVDLGYKKTISTPHVMFPYYPNDATIVRGKLAELQKALVENDIALETECAAEYYMDEVFLEKIRNKESLLTFNGNHLLIETSFLNQPVFFSQLMFEVKTQGYLPVYAHPERYVYLQKDYELIEKIADDGLLFQINLLSLSGYYSPQAKKLAEWMIEHGYYHFLGTDAHHIKHLNSLDEVFKSKSFNKIDFGKVINARKSIL